MLSSSCAVTFRHDPSCPLTQYNALLAQHPPYHRRTAHSIFMPQTNLFTHPSLVACCHILGTSAPIPSPTPCTPIAIKTHCTFSCHPSSFFQSASPVTDKQYSVRTLPARERLSLHTASPRPTTQFSPVVSPASTLNYTVHRGLSAMTQSYSIRLFCPRRR